MKQARYHVYATLLFTIFLLVSLLGALLSYIQIRQQQRNVYENDVTTVITYLSNYVSQSVANSYAFFNIALLENFKNPQALERFQDTLRRAEPDSPPHIVGYIEYTDSGEIIDLYAARLGRNSDMILFANSMLVGNQIEDILANWEPNSYSWDILLKEDNAQSPVLFIGLPFEHNDQIQLENNVAPILVLSAAPIARDSVLGRSFPIGFRLREVQDSNFLTTYAPETFEHDPLFSSTERVLLFDREWYIDFASTEEDTLLQDAYIIPAIIALSGTLVGFLIAQLFAQQMQTRNKALSMALQVAEDLQASRETTNAVIENAPFGFLLVSYTNKIVQSNYTAHRMLGYHNRELYVHTIEKMLDETAMIELEEYVQHGRRGSPQSPLQLTFITKDKKPIQFSAVVTTFMIEGNTYTSIFFY